MNERNLSGVLFAAAARHRDHQHDIKRQGVRKGVKSGVSKVQDGKTVFKTFKKTGRMSLLSCLLSVCFGALNLPLARLPFALVCIWRVKYLWFVV